MTVRTKPLRSSARGKVHQYGASSALEPRNHLWVYLVLIAGVVAMLMPFVWMLLGSFKTNTELLKSPPTWWPENATLSNYGTLFTKLDLPTVVTNSIVVASAVTVGHVVFGSMAGYALAKMDFRGKKALFTFTMSMLMVPGLLRKRR